MARDDGISCEVAHFIMQLRNDVRMERVPKGYWEGVALRVHQAFGISITGHQAQKSSY